MENILFLQSDKKDPFEFYKRMLAHDPVYFDSGNRMWGVYSATACRQILLSSNAVIPTVAIHPEASEHVRFILRHLPRLANAPRHEPLRSVSSYLMEALLQPDTQSIFHLLIGEPKIPASLDWVNDVAKKLPAFALLKGFGFHTIQIEEIIADLPNIVKIMAPITSHEDIVRVNRSVEIAFSTCKRHIELHLKIKNDINVHAANLIGLLIQSYDATRGLLSNAMLRTLRDKNSSGKSLSYYREIVGDTLRNDPPIHNTRRVLTEDTIINKHTLRQGENVLVVLAAAGLEDGELISYGEGVHRCVAEHFATGLTAQALHYLFNKYRYLELLEKGIVYEPRVNVRLPVKMNLGIQ